MRAVNSELPFEAEIALDTSVSVRRDYGNEQCARLDLVPDGLVPGLAAPQLTFVEPDLDARCAECVGDTLCRNSIL